jgi:hypothetical protein
MKKYSLILFLILFLSLVIRIFHFDNRIFIYGDGARDILVARGSLQENIIPSIASFSSAGPFVFGPHYYWLLMAIYKLSPTSWSIFYYFLILQSVFLVFVLIRTGELVWNKKFGLFLGLIAAVSPRLLFRSMAMTQHTIVATAAALSLYFFVKFLKEKKITSSLFTGFWTGIGIMMHYQALGLLFFAPAFLTAVKSVKDKVKHLSAYLFGLIFPCISFILWDASQKFANVNNLMDYLFIGQNRIYIANRWSWHILRFWPGYVADLFGGNPVIGGVILYFTLGLCLLLLVKGKLNRVLKYLLVFFLIFYVYLRFYKGEKFEGYLAYLQPLTFVIIAYGLFSLRKIKAILFGIMVVAFFFSLSATKQFFTSQNVNQLQILTKLTADLENRSGTSSFAVYDLANEKMQTDSWDISDSLTVYLGTVGKLDFKNGYKLGVCMNYCPTEAKLIEVKNDYFASGGKKLLLIGKRSTKDLRLVERSPHGVLEEVLFWWQTAPLKSTFNLQKYILERIPVVNKLIK